MNEQSPKVLTASAVGSTAALTETQALAQALTPGRARPGEFDFLVGEWRIGHRRLTSSGVWDAFTGEATCWTVWAGAGLIEELRIPARDFTGMGVRLIDVDKGVWSDLWVNAKSGVLRGPGMTGGFVNGEGWFVADEMDGDTPIKVRGIWDRITGRSHGWRQSVSHDGGATWKDNWLMDWTKV